MPVISNSFELDNVVYIIILAQINKTSTESCSREQANKWNKHSIVSNRCIIHDMDLYYVVLIHGIPLLFLKC